MEHTNFMESQKKERINPFFANKYHKSDRDIMGFWAYQNITSREVSVLIHSQDEGRKRKRRKFVAVL